MIAGGENVQREPAGLKFSIVDGKGVDSAGCGEINWTHYHPHTDPLVA